MVGGGALGRSVRGKWTGARKEKEGRTNSERAEGARARSHELGVHRRVCVLGVGAGSRGEGPGRWRLALGA